MGGFRAGCLAVEMGRYTGTPYSERVCRLCDRGEVEDQYHFLIICHTLILLDKICLLTALPYQAPSHIYLPTTNANFFYVLLTTLPYLLFFKCTT